MQERGGGLLNLFSFIVLLIVHNNFMNIFLKLNNVGNILSLMQERKQED